MPSPTSRYSVDEATAGLQSLVRAQQLAQERQAKAALRLAKQAESRDKAQATLQEKQASHERRREELETQKAHERHVRAEQSRLVR